MFSISRATDLALMKKSFASSGPWIVLSDYARARFFRVFLRQQQGSIFLLPQSKPSQVSKKLLLLLLLADLVTAYVYVCVCERDVAFLSILLHCLSRAPCARGSLSLSRKEFEFDFLHHLVFSLSSSSSSSFQPYMLSARSPPFSFLLCNWRESFRFLFLS